MSCPKSTDIPPPIVVIDPPSSVLRSSSGCSHRLLQVRCDAASLGVPCTNCVAFQIECRIPQPKRKKAQGTALPARDSDRYNRSPFKPPLTSLCHPSLPEPIMSLHTAPYRDADMAAASEETKTDRRFRRARQHSQAAPAPPPSITPMRAPLRRPTLKLSNKRRKSSTMLHLPVI